MKGGAMEQPEIVLNTGAKMPALGMGTATYPVPQQEVVESAVYAAIKMGYRHFDTASLYGSEEPIARAVERALEDGLVACRSELFITTKLWCGDAHPDGVMPGLLESLRSLRMEYVDLYLIHFPSRLKGEKRFEFSGDDVMELDMKGTWEAMEECYRRGFAKAIGVSNFTCKKLEQILTHANIVPAVNQVELHPCWQQRRLREFCKGKGIHVSAYSPLGGRGVIWGSNEVMENQEIGKIASSIGKSTTQVCLRWALQMGVSFLPKSFNEERLKENMGILNWELSEQYMDKLSHLPQKRISLAQSMISPNGIYKSLEDLWDGEI